MGNEVKHKLLVIDDSDLIRKAVHMLLENAGYEVRVAGTMTEFDELLGSWWPDTILSDVHMPDMMGDELCLRLKSRLLVRVILFSNLPPERLAELAETSGADGYISKLAGFGGLPAALEEILKRTSVAPASSTSSTEAKRVILLDDTELGREVTGTVLAREGFDVRIVADLEEFKAVYTEWVPRVILTSPILAGLKEGEVSRHLRAEMGSRHVPIVFLSEEPSASVVDLARRFGADDGLSRLQGFDELLSRLASICNSESA